MKVGNWYYSKEEDPRMACSGELWKGGWPLPTATITKSYAEFPLDSCPKLRIDF